MIEATMPADWRDLQNRVGRILRECGLETEIEKDIETVRGRVSIDVHAVDRASQPIAVYLCECKHWQASVPKTVVHAFRTVTADYGANWGLVISTAGFQSGAFEAARNSNVRLVTWAEFQDVFEDRWIEQYFAPRLHDEAEPLVDYTEPINARVFRKADELDEAGQQRFTELRSRYVEIAFLALHLYTRPTMMIGKPAQPGQPSKPRLPMREMGERHHVLGRLGRPGLPDDLLDATCLRDFLDILSNHIRQGLAAFDAVFGGRA